MLARCCLRRLGTPVASSPHGRCCVGIPIPVLPSPPATTPRPILQQQQQERHYHSTPRTEIVPLILATVVVGGGYYSYRALQRMNTEWDDYRWALQEYERQQLKRDPTTTTTTTLQQQQSIAVDLGTAFAKLATTHPALQLAISREGDRAFFNGVVYDDDYNQSVVTCRGRTALERFYFAPHTTTSSDSTTTSTSTSTNTNTLPACTVTLPAGAVLSLLGGADATTTTTLTQVQQVVAHVLQPALTEVLDRTSTTTATSTTHNHPAIRKVITVPSSFWDEHNVDLYQKVFADVLGDSSSSSSLVPEPVAAVWGAQFHDILPDDRASSTTTTTARRQRRETTTLVLDVGGYTTQVAVVRHDRVVHSTTLPFGGETVVEQLVEWLVRQQQQQQQHSLYHDARALALLQMQARHAVMELSTQTRAHVHVPYVFANPQQHHLDARIARSVLEQTVQAHVPQLVALLSLEQQQEQQQLSPHVPIPTDFTSLWMSVVTQVLEQSGTLPTTLDHVLLVGGGSKMPLMQATVGQALQQLLGSTTKLFPTVDPTLRSELTVLGAATLLPSCEYSFQDGLGVRSAAL